MALLMNLPAALTRRSAKAGSSMSMPPKPALSPCCKTATILLPRAFRLSRKADTSVRIQALIFTGDESGLYIAELLKEKKAQGLDVRVIVDAMSNPGPQTQWMYFDLKQNGIEVEGYETFYLQWLNEMPVASHEAADETTDPNKRFHEKMWIIDGETDHGVAVVGGSTLPTNISASIPRIPAAIGATRM